MPKIVLNEKAQAEIQQILQTMPISHLNQVQRIVDILNGSFELQESPEKQAPKDELALRAE